MNKQQITSLIEQHFGDECKASVSMLGSMADIELEYTDGPTTAHARRWLDENIQPISNITIYRKYSKRHIANTLMNLYENDSDIMLRIDSLLALEDFSSNDQTGSHKDK